ncbi:hypothetical protein RAH32_11945 [Paracoccus sp. WLY502]|uniref:hypothetical protein n=1 Tax=Paracoccus yibinensis TaxID=3068891 RepID=UPI002796DE7A|nr:hypothetical protein [Paracoccus sp. WLY502]MDQ1901154.1 hypothetical protein [Paracoccus sp. WLY502]
MKDDKIAKPETAVLPDSPGMNLPHVLLWPLRMQEMLWRETLLTMARMAELRAECLRSMAQVSLPMDAAAIQSDYARKLMEVAGEEGNRLARAMKAAVPAMHKAA